MTLRQTASGELTKIICGFLVIQCHDIVVYKAVILLQCHMSYNLVSGYINSLVMIPPQNNFTVSYCCLVDGLYSNNYYALLMLYIIS